MESDDVSLRCIQQILRLSCSTQGTPTNGAQYTKGSHLTPQALFPALRAILKVCTRICMDAQIEQTIQGIMLTMHIVVLA